MEKFSQSIRESEMQYLGTTPKMTEWSVFSQGKPLNITVIQVYATTTDAKEARVDQFYEDIQQLPELIFVIGNWNAKVGSQETPGITGKFGLGVQNEAGQRLTKFCQDNTLGIANTHFPQPKRWLCTCTSPRGQYWNQVDYVLCTGSWRSSLQSVKTRPGDDCGSYHELLIAKFRLKLKKAGRITGIPRWLSGKEYACQCRRHRRRGFDPWVKKIPWMRKWQFTPIFLPG